MLSGCCVCVQFQSVIKAVVEEVDDALQVLHSQVYDTPQTEPFIQFFYR